MTKKIGFAVLGAGFIGKKHQYFIEQNDACVLTAVIDNSIASADYTSIGDFIREDENKTDVVCITTPNGFHVTHAIALIEAGYHVVVEKPLALRAAAALQLEQVAIEHKKRVFTVMQNRYSPISTWLKELSHKGLLGELYMLQVNCFWNRDQRYYDGEGWHGTMAQDGGTIYTQFSHFIDMLYWCFGPMEKFKGDVFNFNHKDLIEFEDSGLIQFEFRKSGIGQFNYSTSCFAKNLESSITILAEKGTLKIGGQYMDKVIHCEIDGYEFEPLKEDTAQFGPYKGNAANHRFVIQNVVDTLIGKSTEHTHVQEGIEVVRIIENMYNSVR